MMPRVVTGRLNTTQWVKVPLGDARGAGGDAGPGGARSSTLSYLPGGASRPLARLFAASPRPGRPVPVTCRYTGHDLIWFSIRWHMPTSAASSSGG
jgi:hypothetical protein